MVWDRVWDQAKGVFLTKSHRLCSYLANLGLAWTECNLESGRKRETLGNLAPSALPWPPKFNAPAPVSSLVPFPCPCILSTGLVPIEPDNCAPPSRLACLSPSVPLFSFLCPLSTTTCARQVVFAFFHLPHPSQTHAHSFQPEYSTTLNTSPSRQRYYRHSFRRQ